MIKTFIKKIIRRSKSRPSSSQFEEYQEYIDIQHRCEPKEFMDHRVNIVSGLAFALNKLNELGIAKKVYLEEGDAKGQLIENQIAILDAGSRDGWVVEFLKSTGYPNVKGVELLEDYANYAQSRGRDVIHGDLHELPFEGNSFDFVHSRHTLEHCLDPVKVLSEFMRVLKSQGILYCSFPIVYEPHGKHTLAISNVNTIHQLLKECQYGFDVIYIGKTEKTPVIPDGDEVIIFLQKK